MKTIFLNNLELIKDKKLTFLTSDVSAGDSTLPVESIIGFAVNLILFIGEPGDEKSEVIKTHATTPPSSLSVFLASNCVFDHVQGTPVYIIKYDQVEFSHAVTIAGTKTVLDTINIQADEINTQYDDSTYSSGYYFTRLKNTIGAGSYSDYSDPIPYNGYGDNTVGAAIDYALKRNKTEFTENVTKDFCIEEINNCLQFARGKLKKWHNLQEFDYSLGATSRGINKFAMPSDAWQYSYKSVLGFRIGSGKNLTYKDKTEFEEYLEGVNHALLSSGAIAGDITITVDDPHDFPDSGDVMIKGQVITYTAIDRTTGAITGIPASGDGAITATLTAGDDVWQGDYEEGNPDIFTVYDGYIRFWPLCSASYIYKNGWMDYWKEAPSVDSDNDTLDLSRYDMVKYWLTWAIRGQLKNDGMRDPNDADYGLFNTILNDAISIELRTHGQKYKTRPLLNQIKF
ncbi:Ig-like domain-containing protein [bacterium]|jgi:hypothetical protein|nr:Ig-like domain-containing protein [bacterium]